MRQAVAYAVNREQIVATVYQGEAMIGNDHVVHPVHPSFDPSQEQRPRDVEMARQLLSDAGLERTDVDFTIAGSCDYLSGMPFAFVANVAANVTTYSDTGLDANTTWRYRVRAENDTETSGWSNIASATKADTTYYNPANMSWIDEGWLTEVDLTWIHLASISYEDFRSPLLSGDSEKENFLLPTFFLVSPDYKNFRFGFSVTAPFGLQKRWNDPYPATFAKKFSLQVFELNPTVSYEFNKYVSIGGGARAMIAKATARNGGVNPSTGIAFSRDLEGDWEVDWGYNLALSVKPNDDLNLSVTYRSNVDLGLSGDATLANTGALTIADNSVDLVISNCVLNLVADLFDAVPALTDAVKSL